MTRKTKIRVSVAALALLVAGIALYPSKDEGKLEVAYAGVASKDPGYACFTISNRFQEERFCDYELQELVRGEWQAVVGNSFHTVGILPMGGTTNITVEVPGTNRWLIEVSSAKRWPDNLFSNTREMLIEFASDHSFEFLENLLTADTTWNWSRGPEMLGPKPWAKVPK